ncbi:MAG: hypothetical protein ACXU82_13770 [Caulobacteraceae bacterium]
MLVRETLAFHGYAIKDISNIKRLHFRVNVPDLSEIKCVTEAGEGRANFPGGCENCDPGAWRSVNLPHGNGLAICPVPAAYEERPPINGSHARKELPITETPFKGNFGLAVGILRFDVGAQGRGNVSQTLPPPMEQRCSAKGSFMGIFES